MAANPRANACAPSRPFVVPSCHALNQSQLLSCPSASHPNDGTTERAPIRQYSWHNASSRNCESRIERNEIRFAKEIEDVLFTWHYDRIDSRDLFRVHVRVLAHCDRCSSHPGHDRVPYRVWWIGGDVGAAARLTTWHWLHRKTRIKLN